MLRTHLALTLLVSTCALSTLAVADEPGVELQVERSASVAPEQMRTNAAAAVDEQEKIVKALTRLSEDMKRKDPSSDGEPCLTLSLASASALRDVTADAQAKMAAALTAHQKERADYEFRKIVIALKESRKLEQEGTSCALGVGAQAGNTRVNVSGPTGDAIADTRAPETDITEYGFDPADVSPF